ncbi:MAG: hypothetical protein ACKO9Z_14020, partial [Planctomycetota bacterium]
MQVDGNPKNPLNQSFFSNRHHLHTLLLYFDKLGNVRILIGVSPMRLNWFSSLFHSFKKSQPARTRNNRPRRSLALERMEDRCTPATALSNSGILTIDFTGPSDQVSASFDGTNITLTGSLATASFSGVDRIVISDSATSPS